jgi:hypothetical protein
MGKRGRILGGVGCAALVAVTTWSGLTAAHADNCVYDGNVSVCGPQRDGVEPAVDGSGNQLFLSTNHWGPVGLPASDDGTNVWAGQWWSTSGPAQWRATQINANVNPNLGVAHVYADGTVQQINYQDETNQQRQTFVNVQTGSWDAPGTPSASLNFQQYRWSPAPSDCQSNAWGSVSVGGFNNNPNFNNFGCPVEVPELEPAPPLG